MGKSSQRGPRFTFSKKILGPFLSIHEARLAARFCANVFLSHRKHLRFKKRDPAISSVILLNEINIAYPIRVQYVVSEIKYCAQYLIKNFTHRCTSLRKKRELSKEERTRTIKRIN